MMFYVAAGYLNIEIAEVIVETIELYRQSKHTLYFDGDKYIAIQEIQDFICSTPYFSNDLKSFLYSRDNDFFIPVSKDWFYFFIEKRWLWSESEEWLFYDAGFILNNEENKAADREELDLTPHSKAIFCCKRGYF